MTSPSRARGLSELARGKLGATMAGPKWMTSGTSGPSGEQEQIRSETTRTRETHAPWHGLVLDPSGRSHVGPDESRARGDTSSKALASKSKHCYY